MTLFLTDTKMAIKIILLILALIALFCYAATGPEGYAKLFKTKIGYEMEDGR